MTDDKRTSGNVSFSIMKTGGEEDEEADAHGAMVLK